MKKVMSKKFLTLCAAAAVACMLPLTASAADKLVVKDAAEAEVFKVDDAGSITLPIAAGVGRGAFFKNAGTFDNFPSIASAPDGSTPAAGMSYQIIPRGTGFNDNIKAQVSVFNTDLLADGTNYEALVLRTAGTRYSINATSAGTGQPRRIEFQMQNQPMMTIETNGNVGIGTITPSSKLAVVGLPSGTTDGVADGNLAGALCITDTGNLYIDTDGSCSN